MNYASALLLTLAAVTDAGDIGDGLWRTFGHQTELPITTAEAIAQKWVAVTNCETNLGILYTKDKSGPTEKHPLGLRFTASGKIAGVQATVFGDNRFGDAAQKNLIDLGYWKKTGNATKTWHMDVSFRAPEDMCSTTSRSEEVWVIVLLLIKILLNNQFHLQLKKLLNKNGLQDHVWLQWDGIIFMI